VEQTVAAGHRYSRSFPLKKERIEDGPEVEHCVYTSHALRATTATLLLDAGVDIKKVQDLLGRRHITTTQIYGKLSATVHDFLEQSCTVAESLQLKRLMRVGAQGDTAGAWPRVFRV